VHLRQICAEIRQLFIGHCLRSSHAISSLANVYAAIVANVFPFKSARMIPAQRNHNKLLMMER